jgi:hypothetical protein
MSVTVPPCVPAPDGAAVAARAAPRQWEEDGATHIDVRGLAPPQPLVAILRLVRGAAPGVTVIVHHDREPMLLYPELAELRWEAARIPGDAGEVRLLLRAAT